jgi:PAS domain S-box-containing protein
MTPSFSRRSFRIVVFSAIAVCAWTSLGLAISVWIFRPAGSPVWPGLINTASLVAAAGSIWVFFRADLAGWRQAQRDLVRDSRQLGLIAETANIGLWDWNPKTNEIVFSDQWRRQIGYTETGIENHLRAWLRLVHPEDESRLRAAFQASTAQPGAGFEATFRLRHHDGTWRVMLARGAVTGPSDGGFRHLVGVQLDVTERRQAEDERRKLHARLLESQKLESLGLLAGSIAHDFNNLLSGVLSNAELAELDLPEEGPLNARIEQIKQAAIRMADLSREMLAYSGRGSFNVTYVDLNALVREMSNLLTTGISKRVHLCYKFTDVPVVVEAEATQIRQVLMNLITNASDAMNQKSGAITLTTGVIEAHAVDFEGGPWANELQEGSYAFFEVEDKGCGMTPEIIHRMFEPFYTTKPHGRGLGLAAVQDIVRRHHGALRICSAPGAGTTVRVLLPLPADMAGPPNTPPPMETSWRGTGTVLVVDDDETARDTAATLLAYLGFQVLLAADGDDALRCFQRAPEFIRAVLLDATIPGLEGREVVVRLHAQRPNLPVLLTSGYSEGEVMKDYAGVRLNGFVLKPLEVGRLSNVLRESLSAQSPVTVKCGSRDSGPVWPTPQPVWT